MVLWKCNFLLNRDEFPFPVTFHEAKHGRDWKSTYGLLRQLNFCKRFSVRGGFHFQSLAVLEMQIAGLEPIPCRNTASTGNKPENGNCIRRHLWTTISFTLSSWTPRRKWSKGRSGTNEQQGASCPFCGKHVPRGTFRTNHLTAATLRPSMRIFSPRHFRQNWRDFVLVAVESTKINHSIE